MGEPALLRDSEPSIAPVLALFRVVPVSLAGTYRHYWEPPTVMRYARTPVDRYYVVSHVSTHITVSSGWYLGGVIVVTSKYSIMF